MNIRHCHWSTKMLHVIINVTWMHTLDNAQDHLTLITTMSWSLLLVIIAPPAGWPVLLQKKTRSSYHEIVKKVNLLSVCIIIALFSGRSFSNRTDEKNIFFHQFHLENSVSWKNEANLSLLYYSGSDLLPLCLYFSRKNMPTTSAYRRCWSWSNKSCLYYWRRREGWLSLESNTFF